MTLAGAVAILTGGPAAERSVAWSRLFEEVGMQSRVVWRQPSDAMRDDASQTVLVGLIRAIERGVLTAKTDSVVRAYIRRALHNAYTSLYRQGQKQLRLEVVPEPGAWDAAVGTDEAGTNAVDRALALVDRVGEAACVASPRAAAGIRKSVGEMVSLAQRETTVRAILTTHYGADPTDEASFRKKRDALFKRHERVRTRLLETTSALLAAGEVTPNEAQIMERCVQGWLMRRKVEEA